MEKSNQRASGDGAVDCSSCTLRHRALNPDAAKKTPGRCPVDPIVTATADQAGTRVSNGVRAGCAWVVPAPVVGNGGHAQERGSTISASSGQVTHTGVPASSEWLKGASVACAATASGFSLPATLT